jgi:hypothetical protein
LRREQKRKPKDFLCWRLCGKPPDATGSLLTRACRKLEPGDKMGVCEPIHKS